MARTCPERKSKGPEPALQVIKFVLRGRGARATYSGDSGEDWVIQHHVSRCLVSR